MKDKLTQLKKSIYKKYSPELKIKKKNKIEKKIENEFQIIPERIDLNWPEKTLRFSRNKRKYFFYFVILLFSLNILSFIVNYDKKQKLTLEEEIVKMKQLQKESKEQKQIIECENKILKLQKEIEIRNKKIEKLKTINKDEKINKIKQILEN